MTDQITYGKQKLVPHGFIQLENVPVFLGGKQCGVIRGVSEFVWQYIPKGQALGGDLFQTLADCKQSLEPDND